MPSDPADENRLTVDAYDAYAERYAEVTQASHFDSRDEGLDLFAARMKPGGAVLEVASGPGWDADVMEGRGLTVRRTDLSEGFIAVQAKRGKRVERLNLTNDDQSSQPVSPALGDMVADLEVHRRGIRQRLSLPRRPFP